MFLYGDGLCLASAPMHHYFSDITTTPIYMYHGVTYPQIPGEGLSPQILVGMCRGEVKNGGLRSELERESGGLWNWLVGCVRLAGILASR